MLETSHLVFLRMAQFNCNENIRGNVRENVMATCL